jgi:DNA-binding transcriptional ArsR family regulator
MEEWAFFIVLVVPKKGTNEPKKEQEERMIEQLVTSQTRVKLLKLFLSNIDKRYYLRELERLLNESLSPLRRQLIKLVRMGILNVEDEGNLKYYSLNKNFVGIGELQRLLVSYEIPEGAREPLEQVKIGTATVFSMDNSKEKTVAVPIFIFTAVLTTISIFILITAIYVVQGNMKNIRQVTNMISENKPLQTGISKSANPASGEMISRKWKILPGNFPVFSSGETDEGKNSKEL